MKHGMRPFYATENTELASVKEDLTVCMDSMEKLDIGVVMQELNYSIRL